MNKQKLASKIWEAANKMRSKIEANEYKDYILGFIFYKYLSDKEIEFANANDFSDEDVKLLVEEDFETVKFISDNLGYFIAYENLFSTWIDKGKDFDVSNVRDALSGFNRLINPKYKKIYEGIFDTLQTGLSKLGDSAASQTKAVSELINLIDDIPMNKKQGYDVLGFIYEYLISMFAANAGKKAGEFYTPHEVSLLMSEIVASHLNDKKHIEIYDPTSGSGSLLINIGQCVAKHMDDENNVKYYAQELKQNTYNLTRMNLVMRDILPDNIVTRNGDTLEDDWPYFDENNPVNTYDPLYVDAVVSNPPYSQNWDPSNKGTDPRYAKFGLAPKSKADYAFLLHDLYHIKPDGIMTIVLPHGVLFRGGEEGTIRKNLIEGNHIDTIIGLPANIFFGTGIPTIIMVLKQKRENTDIQIIDASKGFIKVGKNNILRASDIKKISDTVSGRFSVDKYSKIVTREEIRSNEYNLNIPRYVDSSENAETWDVYAIMSGGIPKEEISCLDEYWQAFPGLKEDLFSMTSTPYTELKSHNINAMIKEHKAVHAFNKRFSEAFHDFRETLKNELTENMLEVNVIKEESVLSNIIFDKLAGIPLIDNYVAYQMLDDEWGKIAIDLEIIQTESLESIKKVDPNMVIKKKNGKEQEIQEGWKGRILPFELIQEVKLSEELKMLNEKYNRLFKIASEYEELLDSLSEEEKELEIVKEKKDGFINAVITKETKRIKEEIKKGYKLDEESIDSKILKLSGLIAEEKELKNSTKKESLELHLRTKEIIENLSDEEAKELIEIKWITPLNASINRLPENIILELISKTKLLSEKYDTTYLDVATQINDTEKELSKLINNLVGSEYDMKGLSELQTLLTGEQYD